LQEVGDLLGNGIRLWPMMLAQAEVIANHIYSLEHLLAPSARTPLEQLRGAVVSSSCRYASRSPMPSSKKAGSTSASARSPRRRLGITATFTLR
jgi:hypothetical protein